MKPTRPPVGLQGLRHSTCAFSGNDLVGTEWRESVELWPRVSNRVATCAEQTLHALYSAEHMHMRWWEGSPVAPVYLHGPAGALRFFAPPLLSVAALHLSLLL